MRKLFLIAGLAVAVAAPSVATVAVPTDAEARTACQKDRRTTRIAGTVGGGVLGALAGRAIAGRGENTEGMIIGGVAGAVAGNQLTKKKNPCPAGYVAYTVPDAPRASYRSSSTQRVAATPAAQRCSWQDQAYRDAYGNLINRQVQVCR